jgi:hypothetical protein
VLGSDNKWELELKSKKDNKNVYTDSDPILNGSGHW